MVTTQYNLSNTEPLVLKTRVEHILLAALETACKAFVGHANAGRKVGELIRLAAEFAPFYVEEKPTLNQIGLNIQCKINGVIIPLPEDL